MGLYNPTFSGKDAFPPLPTVGKPIPDKFKKMGSSEGEKVNLVKSRKRTTSDFRGYVNTLSQRIWKVLTHLEL